MKFAIAAAFALIAAPLAAAQTTSDAPDTCRKIVARYYDTVRKVDGRWLIADKYMQIGWTQEFHH